MRFGPKQFWLALAAMFLFIAVELDRAQQMPGNSHATSFSTDMYYEVPNEDKIKMRLSGSESLPLPGGYLDVKNMKVEAYSTNGTMQLKAESPQCTLRYADGVADSPGHLEMTSGDGKIHITADGFLLVLKQDATSLILSNNVHTVVESGLLKP
ncbi:MAG TPA: hypothetical protein VK815_10730 [Candidatus Acidoferrales bacterium]|jgi:hypothetical protein|nr:hypothetical protein [Candidatus Acidoferrales bacterium]